MKRLVCTVCSVLLCVGLLSGCGTSLEGEESVVYVGKKGVIESLDVESLDQSYYDETELKSYVDAEVKITPRSMAKMQSRWRALRWKTVWRSLR